MSREFKGIDIAAISLELETAIRNLKTSMEPDFSLTTAAPLITEARQTQLAAVAEGLSTALRASQLALLASVASLGECRQAVPYSPLRPIIDENGKFKWCCNHKPEHCS